MTNVLEQIGELLSEIGAADSFTARRTAETDDLRVEVRGIGRLRYPISRAQAQRLCRVARPARYGRGEKTLLDQRVRDTWEIPKSRVKIDRRRWNRTLLPLLDKLRDDLGLADGCKLKAELHSMLVYAPGQFFLPHQDTEKADEMVGTLVVTLPSAFAGGVMVVRHQGEKVTYRASKRLLSFVAFYADCHHEVRPVKEGYRIVLTYNLMLVGDRNAVASAETPPATVNALAECLGEHFETPRPPRRHWDKDAPPRPPASRLVYLLDHQYTERGFGWHRLKGNDAARASALRAAAERRDCELALALAEVHEIWGCMEPGWNDRWYGRHRRWTRDEDNEWDTDFEPPPTDDPDAYELQDLHDSSIELTTWIDPSGKQAEPIVTSVAGEEVCSTTPSSALHPYASEYEGYMGNWGNTMDRWYRRAAIVLWPRELAFAVRAEASPAWALGELRQRIRGGERTEAQAMAASLLPFWEDVAPREERRGFLTRALRVAEGLDDPELAASLLRPFVIEALTPGPARAFVPLLASYGERWARAVLAGWCGSDQSARFGGQDRLQWLTSLARLCRALQKDDDAAGTVAARLLLREQWRWLQQSIKEWRGLAPPSQRDEALASLAQPLLGFLDSTAVTAASDLRDTAVAFLQTAKNDPLLPCLLRMLRTASRRKSAAKPATTGLDVLARHCTRRIEARLEAPTREDGDWSMALPGGCRCELCIKLETFLSNPEEKRLEWPIAKAKRMHVHRRIDAHELPVRHQTRRSGSPYTLMLTKTEDMFAREARQRLSWSRELEWLASRNRAASPSRKTTAGETSDKS